MLNCGIRCQGFWVALIINFCSSAHGQTAAEVVSLAAKASFEGTVSSLSLQFEAKITDPPLNGERLGRLVDRQKEVMRISIERLKGQPELQKEYEDALLGIEESVRQQAEGYRIREVVGTYSRLGPFFGGDSLYEAKIEKGTDPPYSVFLLQRRLDDTNLRSVLFDSSSKFVVVSADGGSVGIPDPMFLGRLPTHFYSLNDSSPVVFEFDASYKPQHAGEVAIKYHVGIDSTKKTTFGRLVLNPERGYICPYFDMNNSVALVSRIVCDDFVQAGSGRDWFPTSVTVSAKEASGGVKETLIKIRESSLRLNEKLAQEIFSIDVPAGTSFTYRLGSERAAESVCRVNIDIDGLPTLLDHQCLVIQGTPLKSGGYGRHLFIYGSALLLLAVGSFFIYKKSRKKS